MEGIFWEIDDSGPSCLWESNDVSHWSVAGFTAAQSAAGWGVWPAEYGNELLTSSVISHYVLAMKGSESVMAVVLFPQQPNGPLHRSPSL